MKFQARNNYIINWPEYPLLRITICFMIGIFLSDFLSIPMNMNILILIGLLGMFIFFNSTPIASKSVIRFLSFLVLIIGISLGVFRGNLQKGANNAFHYLKYVKDKNIIIGRVASELKKKKRVSAMFEVERMNDHYSKGKLLVYFGKGDSLLNYQNGDLILLKGKVQILKDNPNPKSFNYRDYLKYKGVDAQVFLKDGDHRLLAKGRSNIISSTALRIRKWALSIFENRLHDRDQLATASAMVLGYREHLSQDLYTSFSETGAVHVLAVSGLHVGIICMIFILFFNRFKNDSNWFKVVKLITLLTVVWAYTLVTGASPAVLRAAVMFSLILIGRLWFKGANIYNILACSALIILMYDPYLLFQLSFQFSYLALISILFFQPRIERLYETKHWITTKVWQLTTVSIAAQILIFPISVFYFHQFPTYFILSGISAVFLATFILGLGLLLLCLNGVPFLGDILSVIYSKLLEAFIQIIAAIQSLPFNSVDGVYISKSSVILLYLLIGTLMMIISLNPKNYKDVFQPKLTRKRMSKIIIATCVILLLSNSIYFTFRTKNNLELIVYDISKDTALDIFYGDELFTIRSENLEEKKEDFAANSFRNYNGNPNYRVLNDSIPFDKDLLILAKNGSLIFKNKHLLFADKLDLKKAFPCKSDVLLVMNKTEMLPYKLLKDHTTNLVVLDNSLTYRIKNQWLKECQKRGIDVHDVRRDGVFRM